MGFGLRPQFLRVALKAGAATVVVVWVVFVALSDGARAPRGRLGGDFPAFYAAGKLVVEGKGASLYQPEQLQAFQRPYLLPDERDSYLKFAYPPFVAVLYAPFALIPYRAAYALHTLIMLSLLLLAARASTGHRRRQHAWLLTLSTLVLFLPLSEALRGGQNTVLTLVLLVASISLARSERFALAGACCAALAFKPQFFFPFALALMSRFRSVTFVVGMLVVLVALYLLGVAALGWFWPQGWLEQAMRFREEDFNQGDKLISFAEQLEVLGVASIPSGVAIAVYLLGSVLGAWFLRARKSWLGLVCIVLLCVPHCVYYDAGLLALGWPGMLAGAAVDETKREKWFLALVAVGVCIVAWGTLGTLLCLAGVGWCWSATSVAPAQRDS